MSNLIRKANRESLGQLGWWIIFLTASVYGLYALYMGGLEIAALLGLTADAPPRAVPVVFVLHALGGGIALIAGALQFNRELLKKKHTVHRWLGLIYVVAIWLSSIAGFWSALFFEVNAASRIIFSLLAMLWFGTTTLGYIHARERHYPAHREWMIRSYALSFFFVTFSFWIPALAGTSLPQAAAFPMAVFFSWSVNLVVAEIWIRRRYGRLFPARQS